MVTPPNNVGPSLNPCTCEQDLIWKRVFADVQRSPSSIALFSLSCLIRNLRQGSPDTWQLPTGVTEICPNRIGAQETTQRAKEKLKKVLIGTLRKTRKALCSQGKKWTLQKMEYSERERLLLKKKNNDFPLS